MLQVSGSAGTAHAPRPYLGQSEVCPCRLGVSSPNEVRQGLACVVLRMLDGQQTSGCRCWAGCPWRNQEAWPLIHLPSVTLGQF